MNDHITKPIHADLDNIRKSPGGLFDTPITELDLNIGKRGRYLNPTCLIEYNEFTIQTVQYNYRRELCYRVICDGDVHGFGRVAHPSEIEVL